MSTPNPLAPQGSLLEQQARSKSSLQIASLIVALHVFVLGGFLILGCDKDKKQGQTDGGASLGGSAQETNLLGNTLDSTTTNLTSYSANPQPNNPFPLSSTNYNTQPPPVSPPVINAPVVTDTLSTAAPAAGASEYKVKNGDNPAKIAKVHGVTTKALMDANPGLDPKKLKPGMTLQIPASTSSKTPASSSTEVASAKSSTGEKSGSTSDWVEYTVKGGDNLSKLARKYGTTVKALKSANGLKSNDIQVGKKLKVPASEAASAAPSSGGSATTSANSRTNSP